MPEKTEGRNIAVPFNPNSLKKGESYKLNETPDGRYKVGQVGYTANSDYPGGRKIGGIQWAFPRYSSGPEVQIGLEDTGYNRLSYFSLKELEDDGFRVVDARFTEIGVPDWLDKAYDEQQNASIEERRTHTLAALKQFYLETVKEVPDDQEGLSSIIRHVGILAFTEPVGLAWIDYTWRNWKALGSRELYQAKPVPALIEEFKLDKLFIDARARVVQLYGEAPDETENELITLGYIFDQSIRKYLYRDKRPSKKQAEDLVALLRLRGSQQANSMANQLERKFETFQVLTAYS